MPVRSPKKEADPFDDPPRPTLSRGFWLMIALSGISLAGAIALTLMTPKPANARVSAPSVSPGQPSATSRLDPNSGADFGEPEAWMETGHGSLDDHRARPGAPTEAVEVDDEFGAALQPAGGASAVSQTLGLIRALGEWVKGR